MADRRDDEERCVRAHSCVVKIEEIDAAIEKLIFDDTHLARRFEILLSIPGVSKITAFALLIETPELGSSKSNRL